MGGKIRTFAEIKEHFLNATVKFGGRGEVNRADRLGIAAPSMLHPEFPGTPFCGLVANGSVLLQVGLVAYPHEATQCHVGRSG